MTPRTMPAERLAEIRSKTWQPTFDELLAELDAERAVSKALAEALKLCIDPAGWPKNHRKKIDAALALYAAQKEKL